MAWLRKNEAIKNKKVIIKKSGLTHQLIIGAVRIEDEGKYIVIAKNERGEVQKTTDVRVNVKR